MCGIGGVMMRQGAPAPETLQRLQSALWHRGPDSLGVFTHGAVGMVATRLSIMDIEHGDQPLLGAKGAVLVANGEIYNAEELRQQLPEVTFRSHSDCEPVVHLYEKHGLDYTQALRGMFALAIYDPALDRLVLTRDPFGIKPLYYIEHEDYFAFASEPQALLKAGLAEAAVQGPERAELMQLKYTTGKDTVIPAVERVLPGEILVIQNARIVERSTPTVLAKPKQLKGGKTAAKKAFGNVMADSVAAHLHADVPCGLFLSGGVDSSILLTLMQRQSSRPVPTITVGYEGHEAYDESREAQRIAAAAGADCSRVEMSSRDFWRLAPRIAAAIDDPTADIAVLPTYMLGQAAADHGLKVVLCGEGGDELFGGYARYLRATLLSAGRKIRSERRGVFQEISPLRDGFSGWDRRILAVERRETQAGRSRLQVLQAIDNAERLPNNLLIKLDRCLMAHGVEGRTPFLDRRIAEFAWSLADRRKANIFRGKVLLRDWLAEAFPEAKSNARKKGFNAPVGAWMAARSAEIGPLVAAQPGIAEFLDGEVVKGVFQQPDRAAQAAWSLLYYALWHSHHIMGLSAQGDIGEVLHAAQKSG